MISGNLHADVEQLYLDSGVVKVADFGLSKSLVPVDRHGQMNMNLSQVSGVLSHNVYGDNMHAWVLYDVKIQETNSQTCWLRTMDSWRDAEHASVLS